MKGKIGVLLLCICIVGIIFFCLRASLSRESVGTSIKSPKEEEVSIALPTQFEGVHFQAEIPVDFREKNHTIFETGPLKESALFVKQGVMSETLSVSLEERSTGSFEESGTYQMRDTDESYKKIRRGENEKEGVLFTKESSPFEVTLFYFEEPYLVSATYTGATKNTEAEKLLFDLQEKIMIKNAEMQKKGQESLQ